MFVSARTNKEHHHLLPRLTLSPPSLIIQCKFPADCHRDEWNTICDRRKVCGNDSEGVINTGWVKSEMYEICVLYIKIPGAALGRSCFLL
jgi:hypothetical protein